MAESTGTIDPRASTAVLTLLGNGFIIDSVQTRSNYTTFACNRYNEFGVQERYVFALLQGDLEQAAGEAIVSYAKNLRAEPVVIGETYSDAIPGLTGDRFQARLGGPIRSWLPLEESFEENLTALGHNESVEGLPGQPDDLFEEFVQIALQFILRDRVIRFGKQRSGEALPDGIGLGSFTLLYDAKAYAKGYSVDKDSIRQFSSYVDDFHRKYEAFLGRVHTFVVVSGHFLNSRNSLEGRSAEMHAASGVRLAYLCASDLGQMTSLLSREPRFRNSIDWKRIFSEMFISAEAVLTAIKSAQRDGIV